MKPIRFERLINKIEIVDTLNAVRLSSKRKKEIEEFWIEVNKQESFHRGEVFHVDAIIEEEDRFKIMLKHTDYAHYLHTIRKRVTDNERCKVVFGAALAETKDEKFVFGQMADYTAHPGRFQCVGGGLSKGDKNGKYFDMKQSVLRELREELAVTPQYIEACVPVYIKSGGTFDSLVVLHHIKLKLTEVELRELYNSYIDNLIRNGEQPEFKQVIYLEKNKDVIHQFFNDQDKRCEDYLEPFLKRMVLK